MNRTIPVVILLCWAGILSEGYDIGVMGAILPALATDPSWHLSPLQLGALGSWAIAGMFVGGIAVGTLSDLYGRKRMFVASLVVFSLSMAALAWSPSPGLFALFRFLGGIGLGGIIPVAAALTVEYSSPARQSANYGLMYSGYTLGILVAALVANAVLAQLGWRAVVVVGVAAAAAGAGRAGVVAGIAGLPGVLRPGRAGRCPGGAARPPGADAPPGGGAARLVQLRWRRFGRRSAGSPRPGLLGRHVHGAAAGLRARHLAAADHAPQRLRPRPGAAVPGGVRAVLRDRRHRDGRGGGPPRHQGDRRRLLRAGRRRHRGAGVQGVHACSPTCWWPSRATARSRPR